SAEIATAIGVPVATGEIEATRWGFRALIEERAASIIQPDATVVGGVSEWMRIANMASGCDIPVAPHWMANLHVHLVASASNGLTVEYFLPEEDVFNFERLVVDPLRVSEGVIEVPVRPGHGIELDDAAVQRFTVA